MTAHRPHSLGSSYARDTEIKETARQFNSDFTYTARHSKATAEQFFSEKFCRIFFLCKI